MVLTTVIDPPSGWMYGFPRIIPLWVKPDNIDEWIIAVGYPRVERDSMHDHFYCRYWTVETPEDELPTDYYTRNSI